MDIENNNDIFQVQFEFDLCENVNSITIKHTHNPILLIVSLNSSYFVRRNLELMFGLKTEDLLTTGLIEIKEQLQLFKSYLALSKVNRTVELVLEAPLYSEMDKAKFNGMFNIGGIAECDIVLSAALSFADNVISEGSGNLIKNDETLGLIVKPKFKKYEDLTLSFLLHLNKLFDAKANLIVKLPSSKPYEFSFICLASRDSNVVISAQVKWSELTLSAEYKFRFSPFYSIIHELNVRYLQTKLQFGAWIEPKEPVTDYVYFVDVNEKRIIEICHALVLQENHFKSKFMVQSALEGHTMYGVDLELKNVKDKKTVRLLVSAPQLGTDLGINLDYNYDSLLNYTLLAQIKIPYNNNIKIGRLYSLNQIHPHLNQSKVNHTIEFSDFGMYGLETDIYGPLPFIWQGEISSFWSRLIINNTIYSFKSKSFLQQEKVQLLIGIETPYHQFRNGELLVSGTQQLLGSQLILSMNHNEILNVSFTEVELNTRQIVVLTMWRNMIFSYFYEVENGVVANGYICWDLLNKHTSQLGLSVRAVRDNMRYENTVEVLLPSLLITNLGVKTIFVSNDHELFSLLKLNFPGLELEGKLASETSSIMMKSGLELKWVIEKNLPKNIGIFYVTEGNEEEMKYYWTLQHFALENDLMMTVYIKNTLYGINLQYSPTKDEEITVEFGYWLVEESGKEKSGLKIVVLHPATNTLMYGITNITSTNNLIEAGLSINYLANMELSKVKYVELYGKMNKQIPEIFVGLSSNGNSLKMGGSMWNKENYLHGITVEGQVNQKEPLKLELIQNMADPGIEAELSYSLSRSYRIFAGMPNSNELTTKISHTTFGKPNLDALATLRLNSSRILWGRFDLPPMTDVGQEFYSGIIEEYTDVQLVSQGISSGFVDLLQEDFTKKTVMLLNAVSAQTEMLISQTYSEVAVFSSGFEAIGSTFQQAYSEDHFYMRTVYQHLTRASATFYRYFSCAVQIMTNMLEGVLGPMMEVTLRIWKVVQSVLSQWKMFATEMGVVGYSPIKQLSQLVFKYQNLRMSLIQYAKQAVILAKNNLSLIEARSNDLLTQAELAINQLIRSIEKAVAQQVQRIIDYTDTILAGFSVLGDTIEGMVDIVIYGVYQIREVRYSINWTVICIDDISTWFANFRLGSYLKELGEFIERVKTLIISDVEKNFGEYEIYLVKAKDMVEGQYENLSQIPQVGYVRNIINNFYQKIKWFWNYAKLNEKLKDAVRKYLENLKTMLDEFKDQFDQNEKELRTEYDYNAENNSFSFTQELPFEWKGFNQFPEYKGDVDTTELTVPAQDYSNMIQTMANYLWQDAKLLPYLLPPFGADALLSGESFITFDNTYYHFHGGCNSYLLASDLYHNSFSLIVNYKPQNKRELILISQDVEIVVKNSLEVFVNGNLEDLPLKLGIARPITIERKVHSVLVSSVDGFSLECSSFQDMCKFHLDGLYIGKTAGLLGTYNNEPLDDFITPSREQSQNINEFTSSWAIDVKSCESSSADTDSSSEDIRPYESMCELFFSSQSSPFFPCFHVVNPKSFYEMCLAKSKQDNTCTAVMAYLTKCTSSGVQLWMPDFCVDDSITDATMLTGYSDVVEIPSRMAADVVLVVEKARCVDNQQLDISSLVASLNSDLRSKGISDTNFALISFDSETSQIQTVNGSIWTENEERLVKIASQMGEEEESPSLYYSALDLASNVPFRAGASKMVILIHCSSCSHDENYGSILERFNQNDISLHILQKENIMSKKGKVVSKAIGIERSGAYPRKRLVKNTMPSPQLLDQVSVPQDLCTPLMIGTNGTLFQMDIIKKGMRTWSGRVAQGALPLTAWKQCENSVGSDNVPVWRCHKTAPKTKLKDWDQTMLDEYMDTSPGVDLYTEYDEVDR